MIRVAIIGESLLRREALARVLADDERFDIVEARRGVDVIVVIEPRWEDLPNDGPPMVVLGGGVPPDVPLEGVIRACLPPDALPAEVAAAISAAACDLTCLTQAQVRRWLRASVPHSDEPVMMERLTPRELQVLRMLAGGLGNKEIAGQLGISDHTAKFHVAQILAKLGAGSRAEAVVIGIRRGLVPI